MSRGISALSLAALLAVGVAGGIGLAARLERSGDTSPANLDSALTLQSAFNRAATLATKAVVHITLNDGFSTDNVGSGVIVSAQGHIVTNYHVIRPTGGGSCLVRFVDGSEFEATVRGVDEESDIAVLKIEPGSRILHPVVFADSDKARVGDIVFAVGSPFGYTHTVTSGIVSAKHRRIEDGAPYEDYLQTDAAINPGNSGGALVNLRGELVGLNSAIVSGSRTNDGVGLAIASNLVNWVQGRLIRDGIVTRGFLGIIRSDVDFKGLRKTEQQNRKVCPNPILPGVTTTEDLVRRLGLSEPSGALVVYVIKGMPAHAAGLKVQDVITELEGRPIRSASELSLRIMELEPGTKVTLKFVRDGQPQKATVTLEGRDPFSIQPRMRR
ncbi:MAG TPA: trypsin-like peptidase domain-containing protein [Planctomycetota bacterium]|nr:trypsin-like peptidase domain-containing protein [Planctomycetota bacterium]